MGCFRVESYKGCIAVVRFMCIVELYLDTLGFVSVILETNSLVSDEESDTS